MNDVLFDLKSIINDTSKATEREPVRIPETEEVIAEKTEEIPIIKSKRSLIYYAAAFSVLMITVFIIVFFMPYAHVHNNTGAFILIIKNRAFCFKR